MFTSFVLGFTLLVNGIFPIEGNVCATWVVRGNKAFARYGVCQSVK